MFNRKNQQTMENEAMQLCKSVRIDDEVFYMVHNNCKTEDIRSFRVKSIDNLSINDFKIEDGCFKRSYCNFILSADYWKLVEIIKDNANKKINDIMIDIHSLFDRITQLKITIKNCSDALNELSE